LTLLYGTPRRSVPKLNSYLTKKAVQQSELRWLALG